MAFQIPSLIQNENLHIHRDKGVAGAKLAVPKSEQKGRKDRKALADLSKTGKPALSGTSKVPSSKEKSAIRCSENTKNIPRSTLLTDEDIKKCQEWAKEGTEHAYFTGNDISAHQKDLAEKRVKKKVETIMSALSGWTQMAYGQERPLKGVDKDYDDVLKLKLEPEVLLPLSCSLSTAGNREIDCPYIQEAHDLLTFPECYFELKLKDEYEGGVA